MKSTKHKPEPPPHPYPLTPLLHFETSRLKCKTQTATPVELKHPFFWLLSSLKREANNKSKDSNNKENPAE